MAAIQLYDTLLRLPLFQGMGSDDLSVIVAHTRFGFQKADSHQGIATTDQPCTHLQFLISGDLQADTTDHQHHIHISEHIHPPYTLQPERLFGLFPRYSRTFTTLTPCHLLTISKEEVLRLTEEHLIFRFNLLNMLAASIQKAEQRLLTPQPTYLRQRIIRYWEERCLRPAGEKTIRMKMTQLATELNDSRLNISRALNSLQEHQLISLSRATIHIPQFEQLLQATL